MHRSYCENLKIAGPPLVTARQKNETLSLFFTIAISPKVKVPVNINSDKFLDGKKKDMIPYGSCTQKVQHDILCHYFEQTYLRYLEKDAYYCVIAEHHKSGDVHVHGLIIDKGLQNRYDLDCFRKTINEHANTKRLCIGGNTRYMNNIVICDDEKKTIAYLEKDMIMSWKHYPIISSVPNLLECDKQKVPLRIKPKYMEPLFTISI